MKVLMFNRAFFYISETFIYKQVTGVPADIELELLGFEIANEDLFPVKNKKYRVKRIANNADRIFIAIRKNIFRIHYRLGLFAHYTIKKILQQTKYDLVHVHF